MNGYEFSTPRVALGLTAVAMAAVTIGVLVVLPAKQGFVGIDPHAVAASMATGVSPQISISAPPIDTRIVVGHDERVRNAHVHKGKT
jgi:hypothetical protein